MIPSTVRIGASNWKVILSEKLNQEEVLGLCDRIGRTVTLATEQSPDTEKDSFLHEVLHACTNFVGLDDGKRYSEEEFVSRLAPILHTVLKDNGCWKWPSR